MEPTILLNLLLILFNFIILYRTSVTSAPRQLIQSMEFLHENQPRMSKRPRTGDLLRSRGG